MAVQKFIVKKSDDFAVVGNSICWRYKANENGVIFVHTMNKKLWISVDGDFIGKEVVFDTSRSGDSKFCGEIKLPKDPVKAGLWKLGFYRGHYKPKEILDEYEEQGAPIHLVRDHNGNVVIKMAHGESRKTNYRYHAIWVSPKVTYSHVKELAWDLGRADTLGIPRQDLSCWEFKEVLENCDNTCNKCKYGRKWDGFGYKAFRCDILGAPECSLNSGRKCGNCIYQFSQEDGGGFGHCRLDRPIVERHVNKCLIEDVYEYALYMSSFFLEWPKSHYREDLEHYLKEHPELLEKAKTTTMPVVVNI